MIKWIVGMFVIVTTIGMFVVTYGHPTPSPTFTNWYGEVILDRITHASLTAFGYWTVWTNLIREISK